MNPESEADSNGFPGCSEVPPPFVRIPTKTVFTKNRDRLEADIARKSDPTP
jgi:hypothetical protein